MNPTTPTKTELNAEIARLQRLMKSQGKVSNALARENIRLQRKVKALERGNSSEFRCIGWLTRESSERLSKGGNGSRGTVPLHDDFSYAASIPVYRACARAAKASKRK